MDYIKCMTYSRFHPTQQAAQEDHAGALRDADKCLALRPAWSKGALRRAGALFGLGRYGDAEAACVAGLAIEDEEKQVSLNGAAAEATAEAAAGATAGGGTAATPASIPAATPAAGSGPLHEMLATCRKETCEAPAVQREVNGERASFQTNILGRPSRDPCLSIVGQILVCTTVQTRSLNPRAFLSVKPLRAVSSPRGQIQMFRLRKKAKQDAKMQALMQQLNGGGGGGPKVLNMNNFNFSGGGSNPFANLGGGFGGGGFGGQPKLSDAQMRAMARAVAGASAAPAPPPSTAGGVPPLPPTGSDEVFTDDEEDGEDGAIKASE
jgi:hypothetical protein